MNKKPRVKPIYYPLELPTLYNTINQIKTPYDQIAKITYIFGLRITETLQLKPQDLTLENINNQRILTCNTITLKNKTEPIRKIPSWNINTEGKIQDDIINYLENKEMKKPLFPGITRQNTYYHFKQTPITIKAATIKPRKTFEITRPLFPHYLRHCRASHLVNLRNQDHLKLMYYMGWSDPKLAISYVRQDWKAIARKGWE